MEKDNIHIDIVRPKKFRRHNKNGFAERGGYMNTKISKLENQFKDTSEKEHRSEGIFNGISIFVNGFTNPTADELKAIMVTFGGTYHHYFSRSKTTHIIATHLPNSKATLLNSNNIVSPKWITESVAAGTLLNYKNYMLHTNLSRSQPKLRFENIALSSSVDYKMTKPVEDLIKLEKLDNYDHCKELKLPLNCTHFEINAQNNKNNEEFLNTTKTDNSFNTQKSLNSSQSLSTANPNFISEFYNNSRLHHISAAEAMFKQYVKELQKEKDNFVGRDSFKKWLHENNMNEEMNFEKVIMHVDMDCFFVSVGLIKYPELKNLPVVVTHAKQNTIVSRNDGDFKYELDCIKEKFKKYDSKCTSLSSIEVIDTCKLDPPRNVKFSTLELLDGKSSMSEIASCSYEARKKGIKNGMFLGAALKLCPELRTIPYDFEGYKVVSKDLYDIIASYTKKIEAVSCDEMYVDLTDLLKECSASPTNFAIYLRQQVLNKTQCPCSVGLGPNKLIARLATCSAKPSGKYYVESCKVRDFMMQQKVTDLPGIGGSFGRRLSNKGIVTCKDLERNSLDQLQSEFGSYTGKTLYNFCRGIDDRKINQEHKRKSVSAEINYGIRFQCLEDTYKFILELSREVSKRLTNLTLKGKTITLKLKVRAKGAPIETAKFMGHGICDSFARSMTNYTYTSDETVIYKASMNLLKQMSFDCHDLRGVGIQVSKLIGKSSAASDSSSILSFFIKKNPNSENKISYELPSTSKIASVPCNIKHGNENSLKELPLDTSKNADSKIDKWQFISNMDMVVFSTLPEEIKQEIIEEYQLLDNEVLSILNTKTQQNRISDRVAGTQISDQSGNFNYNKFPEEVSSSTDFDGTFPLLQLDERSSNSTSTIQNFTPDLNSNENGAMLKVNQDDNIISRFSQIHQSFLNTLPSDIQENLKKDIKVQNSEIDILRNHKIILKPPLLGTKMKKGRTTISKNQILLKKKQGLFIAKKESNQQKKIIKTVENVENICELVSNITKDRSDTYFEEHSSEIPSLCGEIELSSVKMLISQWIKSCDNPDHVDTKILTSYCIELVIDKDLEKLNIILKFLCRKTKCSSIQWQTSFKLIMEEVQKKMVEIYNAKLAVNVC